MEKEEKIWNFFDIDLYKSYQEYENSLPQNVLEFYGEKLEIDTNNLLSYEIVSSTFNEDSYPLLIKVKFRIIIPNKCYSTEIFEIKYPSDKIYPCKFHSLLTENRFDCETIDKLKYNIEGEIKNKSFMYKIYNILYHFYGKEIIKRLNE